MKAIEGPKNDVPMGRGTRMTRAFLPSKPTSASGILDIPVIECFSLSSFGATVVHRELLPFILPSKKYFPRYLVFFRYFFINIPSY